MAWNTASVPDMRYWGQSLPRLWRAPGQVGGPVTQESQHHHLPWCRLLPEARMPGADYSRVLFALLSFRAQMQLLLSICVLLFGLIIISPSKIVAFLSPWRDSGSKRVKEGRGKREGKKRLKKEEKRKERIGFFKLWGIASEQKLSARFCEFMFWWLIIWLVFLCVTDSHEPFFSSKTSG